MLAVAELASTNGCGGEVGLYGGNKVLGCIVQPRLLFAIDRRTSYDAGNGVMPLSRNLRDNEEIRCACIS